MSYFRSTMTAVFVFATVIVSPTSAEHLVTDDDPQLTLRIESLIQGLGAKRYAQRQQAADELRYLGARAWDQLLAAQYASTPEISLASRRLLGQVPITFTREGDPTIVNYALKNYQALPPSIRTDRGEWLAKLEDGVGTEAVCRIVRYEASELIAKQAALDLLKNIEVADAGQLQQLSDAIRDTLGKSDRRPIEWLRAAHRSMASPAEEKGRHLATWKQLVEQEMKLTEGLQSSNSIAAQLWKQYAEQAVAADAHDATDGIVRQLVALQKESPRQLLLIAHWLFDQNRGDLFHKLIFERFDDFKKELPQFYYCAAEWEQARGNAAKANELADVAFAMTAGNENGFADPMQQIMLRFETAIHLENRGLTDWAVREYQRIVDMKVRHWRMSDIRTRSVRLLSELLHDRGKDKEAAEVLALIVKDIEDLAFEDEDLGNETRDIISRHCFFRSEQFRQQSDRAKQMEYLQKGIKANPIDADVLIAMYRLPRADEAWRTETKQYIEKAVAVFESRIDALKANGVVDNRFAIATELNQIAWLVGNTEGDQPEAVRQSLRSLELRPKSAGSLDTLGRAYFAIGDVPNALKYQRRAVRIEPHSRQIARQLAEFEMAASQINDLPR